MKNAAIRSKRNGFSLIELLVVIAIISILIAIIFPVFARVREDGRKTHMISNYRIIQEKLAAYELDHGKYPEVLFGTKIGASDSMTNLRAEYTGSTPPPGLYPIYISDWHVFTDPNNSVDNPATTVSVHVNKLDAGGNLVLDGAKDFFKMDAMDASPMIINAQGLSKSVWVPRYQRAWTSVVDPAGPFPGGLTADDYQRQLALPAGPGSTYVTCTTWHVPQTGKVLVLFRDGHAKVKDVTDFLSHGPDVADVTASGTPTYSPANFWKMQPTRP